MTQGDGDGQRPLGWLSSAEHREWLRAEELRLLHFPRRVVGPSGDAAVFAFDGSPLDQPPLDQPPLDHTPLGQPQRTFDTARLAHVHAIAALRGEPGARPIAFRLLDHLARFTATGWPESAGERAGTAGAEPQSLYTLAFVILAAASGTAIAHPDSGRMLGAALARLDDFFWEPDLGRARDRVDADGRAGDYRGLNGTMHLTEALFAAGEATGDGRLRERAIGIEEFVISVAAERDGRLVEHFDASWNALPEHNRDRPDDAFLPYGSTVGHGFEWARLIAQASPEAPAGFLAAAVRLFDRAAADGWAPAGAAPGFVYTVDWSGRPVVRDRLHWVAAEAVAAAAVLFRLTGEARFETLYETWLDHVEQHFVDRENGSWWHRLTPDLAPVDGGRAPKPDLYHAYQAMLIPQLPVRTSVLGAVRAARAVLV